MKRLLSTTLLLAWGLWLGGLVALFIFAQAMFAHDRAVAIRANPVLFAVFERYQMGLAVVALASGGAMAWMLRTRGAAAVLALVVLATAAAAVSTASVTRKMQALVAAGQASTPEFRRLHGQSMMLYSTSTLALAGATVLLPGMMRRSRM